MRENSHQKRRECHGASEDFRDLDHRRIIISISSISSISSIIITCAMDVKTVHFI